MKNLNFQIGNIMAASNKRLKYLDGKGLMVSLNKFLESILLSLPFYSLLDSWL